MYSSDQRGQCLLSHSKGSIQTRWSNDTTKSNLIIISYWFLIILPFCQVALQTVTWNRHMILFPIEAMGLRSRVYNHMLVLVFHESSSSRQSPNAGVIFNNSSFTFYDITGDLFHELTHINQSKQNQMAGLLRWTIQTLFARRFMQVGEVRRASHVIHKLIRHKEKSWKNINMWPFKHKISVNQTSTVRANKE